MKPTIILFYNTMWGFPLNYRQEELPLDCLVTMDKRLLDSADAVVFHLPDLQWCMNTDEIIKPEGQIWVAWSLECEENYPWTKKKEFRESFNLWMGYHRHDDIVYPYYQSDYKERLFDYALPPIKKKNRICMFISSRINQSHRQEYLAELMKYTPIDSYGKLFNNRTLTEDKGTEDLLKVMSEYKFAIGFENAIAEDYVTEKFYNPLLVGTVPIYRGAPNISEFIPGKDCFVDANAFDTPKCLADYIEKCYKDENLYIRLHEWRQTAILSTFQNKLENIRQGALVRLCEKIKDIKANDELKQ